MVLSASGVVLASKDAGAPEIVVTDGMVEAGVLAAREHCLGAPLGDLVAKVYLAMALEAPSTRASASATSARR